MAKFNNFTTFDQSKFLGMNKKMKLVGRIRLSRYFFCFLILAGVSGCKKDTPFVRQEQQDGHTVTIFDISEFQQESEPLKLSELVKDVRIIPLETSEKCLIGSNAKYYIGTSCILAFQEENILLFDEQGCFKRVVARTGRGPREYLQIRSFCVDEQHEMLFILDDMAKGVVKNYHLSDSAYFQEIKTLEQERHNAVALTENGNLLLVPYPYEKVRYLYYQQTPEGNLGESSPCHSLLRGMQIGSRPLMYRMGEEFRYLSTYKISSNDTVFNITPQGLQPLWIFNCSDMKGYEVVGETPGYLFFALKIVTKREKEETDGGVAEFIEYQSRHFCFHKRKNNLMACEGVLDDCLSGMVWSCFNFKLQDGKFWYVAVSPFRLLARLKTEQPVQVKKPEIWEKFRSNLTEEDNPILIVGDLK